MKKVSLSDELINKTFHPTDLLKFKDFEKNKDSTHYFASYAYKNESAFCFNMQSVFYKGEEMEYFKTLRDFIIFCKLKKINLEWNV